MTRGVSSLHGNSRDNVRSIPEGDIALSARGRVPRHDDQVRIYQDVKRQNSIPDLETWPREPKTLAMVAHENKAHGQCEFEDSIRVDLEVDDKIESIAGRRCYDHNDRRKPLDQVGTKRRAKGASRGPKSRIREDALPIGCQ